MALAASSAGLAHTSRSSIWVVLLALAGCGESQANGGGPRTPDSAGQAGQGGQGGQGQSGQAGAVAGTSSTSGSGAAMAGGGGAAAGAGQSGSGPGAGAGGAPAEGGAAPVIAAGVRWIGRVDVSNPQEVKLAWSGTGFVGSFTGPTVSAKLKTVGGGDIYFQPVVDGKPGPRFSVGTMEKTVELATNLSQGAHRIELYRETEGKGFGYSVFTGFAAGTPMSPPASSGRLIEVIGDSISAGFGNLGAEEHPNYGPDPNGGCEFTTETESAYLAYGLVAARALMADASVLAGSGWGIYSDNGGSTQNVMPNLFGNTLGEQASPPWSFAAQPQAVVINLGTNDASAGNLTSDKFKPAYTAFLKTVRQKYPDALILCAVGSLLSGTDHQNALTYLGEIVAALGDAKVKPLDLGTQDVSKGTGCLWHPNVAENARMAAILTAELKASLGW